MSDDRDEKKFIIDEDLWVIKLAYCYDFYSSGITGRIMKVYNMDNLRRSLLKFHGGKITLDDKRYSILLEGEEIEEIEFKFKDRSLFLEKIVISETDGKYIRSFRVKSKKQAGGNYAETDYRRAILYLLNIFIMQIYRREAMKEQKYGDMFYEYGVIKRDLEKMKDLLGDTFLKIEQE